MIYVDGARRREIVLLEHRGNISGVLLLRLGRSSTLTIMNDPGMLFAHVELGIDPI